MSKKGFVVKVISVVVAVSFLWSNVVWAGSVAGADKLAASSQAGQVGRMLSNAPVVSELMLANRRLNEWGIHRMADVFTKMDKLEQAGIKVLVLKDFDKREARYLFDESGIMLRVTKEDNVRDDLYVLLEKNGVKAIRETIDGGVFEWFEIKDRNLEDLVNSFLESINENWRTGIFSSAKSDDLDVDDKAGSSGIRQAKSQVGFLSDRDDRLTRNDEGSIPTSIYDRIVTRANVLVIANIYGDPKRPGGQLFESYVPDSTIDLIMNKLDDSARAVIFGLRPAVLVGPSLDQNEIDALREAFFVLNHMAGVNIRIVDLGKFGIYIYDDYALIKRLSRDDYSIGITESGMACLIRRDVLSKSGTFFRLVDEKNILNMLEKLFTGYKGKLSVLARMLKHGFLEKQILPRRHHIGIKYLVTCTYGRPKALDNALRVYTQNLEMFGHKDDIELFILDNTPAGPNAKAKDREDAFGNRDVAESYRKQGFRVRYLSREEQEYLRQKYVDYLSEKYGEVHPKRFAEIVDYTFATQNIAGARTVTVALTDGNMANFDDDSLPLAAIVRKARRQEIREERAKKTSSLLQTMYQDISHGLMREVRSPGDFDSLLVGISSLTIDQRKVLDSIITKYYAYSPDGSTGLIPQVVGQMRQVKSEQRLRFQREHNRGQAWVAFGEPNEEKGKEVWLVTTEDDLQFPIRHISDEGLGLKYDDKKAGDRTPDFDLKPGEEGSLRIREGDYDLIPIDFLWVGDESLHRYTGQYTVGMTAIDDERGIGVQPLRQLWPARLITYLLDVFPDSGVLRLAASAYSWINSTILGAFPGSKLLQSLVVKRIALCSMHFNNARDNAAEALFNESYKFWSEHNDGVVDPRDLQQVVMMTIHMGVRGLSSIRFSRWNQDCFNLKTMRLPKAIPTNGAWLRTEEPYYKQLVEFVFTGYSMAWARVVGGHKRLPGERRPNVPKQSFWEEMAMVCWDLYDLIFFHLFKSIRFALISDPYKRLKILGDGYIKAAETYELTDKNKKDLQDTRKRIAATVTDFFKQTIKLYGQKNSSAAGEIFHILAIERPDILNMDNIKRLAKELAEQSSDTVAKSVGSEIEALLKDSSLKEEDLTRRIIVVLQHLPEIQLLSTAYEFAEQYALGIYTVTRDQKRQEENGRMPVIIKKQISVRTQIDEIGAEKFTWETQEINTYIDTKTKKIELSDKETLQLEDLPQTDRAIIIAGSLASLTEEFNEKVTTILKNQLKFDGWQYYYWKDIMDAVHKYYHPDGKYEDFKNYTTKAFLDSAYEQGLIDEDTLKNAKHLLDNTEYGTSARGEIERLVFQKNWQTLKKMVSIVYNRRRNIQLAKDVLDKDKDYKGDDIIIIGSSTEGEAQFQHELFDSTLGQRDSKKLRGKVVVISVNVPEVLSCGQLIGVPYIYLKAEEKARDENMLSKAWAMAVEKNPNLDGKAFNLADIAKTLDLRIGIYTNGGKGERSAPANLAEYNSRGAIELVGTQTAPDGRSLPLRMTLAVGLNCTVLAAKGVKLLWTAQLGYGTNPMDTVEGPKGALLTKFGVSFDPKTLTLTVLNDLGLIEADRGLGILDFISARTFKGVDEAREWFENVYMAAFDYGSNYIDYDLWLAIISFYETALREFNLNRDLDPNFTRPLVALLVGIREKGLPSGLIEAGELRSIEDPLKRKEIIEDARGKLFDHLPVETQKILKGFNKVDKNTPEKSYHYNEILDFYLLSRDIIVDSNANWVGVADLGSNTLWWKFRRCVDILNHMLLMIMDMSGEQVEINAEVEGYKRVKPADFWDRIEAEDARNIRNIRDNEIVRFKTQTGRQVVLSKADVARGVEIEGVYIKNAVIQGDTTLFSGSRIEDSVVNDSYGIIRAKHSFVHKAVVLGLDVERCFVYKLIEPEDQIKKIDSILVDIFRDEIDDPRFGRNKTRFVAGIDYNPKDENSICLADNIKSAEELAKMPCDRYWGEEQERERREDAIKKIGELVSTDDRQTSHTVKAATLSKTIKPDKEEVILYKVNIDIFGNIVGTEEVVRDERFDEEGLKKMLSLLWENIGEGVFGPIREILIVDNLGGIDSDIPEGQRGGAAYFLGDKMVIDIDVFKNPTALRDVGIHESFEVVLRLVENNPGVQEVTATYSALKALLELSEMELDSYIEFLSQPNNGLDSSEYARLLRYIRDNNKVIDDSDLIALSIGYVLNTLRYKHLEDSLKGALSNDIHEAIRKVELVRGIYRDIVKAKNSSMKGMKDELKPAIEKTKLARAKMKIRMVVNSMPVIEIDFVNALVDGGKFIKLDADELMKPENRHIMDWLKKITEGKEKTPFVFYGSGAGELGLKSAQLPEDYKSEDVIDLWDLSKSQPRDRDNLYLPLVYSVSAIYLASEVVMAKGDITKIRDKLAKSTLESLYTVLFGGELSAEQWLRLFKGELWPPVEKITKTLNVLREAMAKIEAAA